VDEPIAVKYFSLGEAGAYELSAVQAAIAEARLLEHRGAATSADSGKISRRLGGPRRGLKVAQAQKTPATKVSV
jgi:hypothetical protein